MKPNDEKLSKFWTEVEESIKNVQYEKIEIEKNKFIINKNKLASMAVYNITRESKDGKKNKK